MNKTYGTLFQHNLDFGLSDDYKFQIYNDFMSEESRKENEEYWQDKTDVNVVCFLDDEE